jgi:hypothetical protein
MASPHELKRLLRMQKESEQRSTYFRIARLPEARVGISHWQLSNKVTPVTEARVRGQHDIRSWP